MITSKSESGEEEGSPEACLQHLQMGRWIESSFLAHELLLMTILFCVFLCFSTEQVAEPSLDLNYITYYLYNLCKILCLFQP